MECVMENQGCVMKGSVAQSISNSMRAKTFAANSM